MAKYLFAAVLLLLSACGNSNPSVSPFTTIIVHNEVAASNSWHPDTTIPAWIEANEMYINDTVHKYWVTPKIKIYNEVGPDFSWNIYINFSGGCGSVGCHEVDDNGLPFALVQFGDNNATIFSHEIIEMMVNPFLKCADIPNHGNRLFEVVDPVASLFDVIDTPDYGFVAIQDFVTPAWFDDNGVTPFDAGNSSDIHPTAAGELPFAGGEFLGAYPSGC